MGKMRICGVVVKRKRPHISRLIVEIDGQAHEVRWHAKDELLSAAILQRPNGSLIDVAASHGRFVCSACGPCGVYALASETACPHVTALVNCGMLPRVPPSDDDFIILPRDGQAEPIRNGETHETNGVHHDRLSPVGVLP